MKNDAGIWGEATIQLFGPDGDLKLEVVKHNLITAYGDEYYAKMGCAGVGGNSAPTLVARMQLGTSTTAVAKSGAGSTTGTYISGSTVAFTTVSPSSAASGWKITYSASWGQGVATATIQEAVITSQTTDAIALTDNTISRVLTGAITKGANDTLVINWEHTFYDNPAA